MYHAYVTKLENVRKHPNADRLLLADCFGNTVCVSLDFTEGQTVIYFPTDGQLSAEFAHANHLCRKDVNGQPDTGYLDPDKRNIRAIKLRGEKSDGLAMPLNCLEAFGDISTLRVGDTIDVFNGHEICKKYIPHGRKSGPHTGGNRVRKKKAPIAPLFLEHADTEQLAYNLAAFKPGDLIEITLKIHGTSQRTGYLPVLKGYKRTLWDRIKRREGTPIYDWGYVTGTRRVVLETYEGGFYGNNGFREPHAKFFEEKLWKGEEVYYEVCGFTDTGAPIMPSVSNKPTNDKDFIKRYGETTTFSYGCEAPNSRIFVYRMTMTNPDGEVVEYTPDFMRYRCALMGVECVPVLWKGYIPETVDEPHAEIIPQPFGDPIKIMRIYKISVDTKEFVKQIAEQYYDGPDPIGETHVREGVVVRIVNRPKFTAYKHKNFSFKVIEGIAKDTAAAPDMEEAEEVVEDEVPIS